MGEPLANYDRTWAAIRRLHDDVGLSARHITLSTVGIAPGIDRMAGEDLPINLAVSLHAANDVLRDELVPINRRYPLKVLAKACERYLTAKGRRLSFEWALINGANDRATDAAELAAYARARCGAREPDTAQPDSRIRRDRHPPDGVADFAARLSMLGTNVTVRRNRGTDINAACGQLRASQQEKAVPTASPTSIRSASERAR